MASLFEPRHSALSSDDDSSKLLNLSSFLGPTKIPFSLLIRGSSSRNRWNSQGNIDTVDAGAVGLPSDLANVLSSQRSLASAMHRLPHAYIKISNKLYEVDRDIANLARRRHTPDDRARWRNWALIVTYRSIPWKYLETVSDDPTLVFPHLSHTLRACSDGFPGLSDAVKIDLGLTLVEASRFSDMTWKQFTIEQAKRVSVGVESPYLASRIALAECVLNRIKGSMLRSAANLAHRSSEETTPDERMHSIAGQHAIQRALNFMQIEALKSAEEVLETWCPLSETPSPMEQAVDFRKAIVQGRSLRQRGEIHACIIKLNAGRNLSEQPSDIVFDEDLRDLICELADALRELVLYTWAENILRSEIERREESYIPVIGKGLLELSLAEVLFARGQYHNAEVLCLSALKEFPRLKYEKIRAYIILAKVYHVISNFDKAHSYWTMALEVINRFPSESSRTSRIILRSLCDAAGNDELREQYQQQLARLGDEEEAGDVKIWIGGMPGWEKYLENRESKAQAN